ncbi:MAG: PEGA domain-containing protein [Caldisericia bacterium]
MNKILVSLHILGLIGILIFILDCTIKYGEIEINSDPQGAKVYLNGKDTGRLTPCVLEIKKFGEYEITLKKF